MYLSAFLHRDELFDITNRWLSDNLHLDDPVVITKSIAYDSFAAWEMLLRFFDELLKALTESQVRRSKIADKKDLKDSICIDTGRGSNRTRRLIADYRKMSEYFYVGSPFAGNIYHDERNRVVGIGRFKRVKRIAEKASRYASMALFEKVKTAAMEGSKSGAGLANDTRKIPFNRLLKAETQVMREMKEFGVVLPVQSMTIADILGIKVIDNGFGETRFEDSIAGISGARIVEKERHSGIYNAAHYTVEVQADFGYVTDRFNESYQDVDYSRRGLKNQDILKDFAQFIITGADTFQIDLILTTFDELIESEIGRSMHEDRIFKQRQQQQYFGNIPTNVEYIIEYLLAVGLSSTVHISEIPIKMWGRYLPDALSYKIRKLYDMPEHCLIGG